MKKLKNILTIAGFDPSGGAGILADIKTIQKHGCQGMAVQTANTIQTEDQFLNVNWMDKNEVELQLNTLLNRYKFDGVKIGLVPSIKALSSMVTLIRLNKTNQLIVWDPVLSASSGFDFAQNLDGLNDVLKEIDWITPNWNECVELSGHDGVLSGAAVLSEMTNVYLKGGHNDADVGKDYIIRKGNSISFNPKSGNYSEKHGSGCVFSTAFTANLAMDYPVQKASLKSKRYVENFLKSTPSKLGIHYG